MMRIKRKLAQEEGAIALATFAFIVFTGIITIFTLWGIAYTSGAYNALYAANQSAAFAAATVTKDANAGSGGTQLQFACAHSPDESGAQVQCRGGRAFDAAQDVLRAAFSPDQPGRFGLTFTPGSTSEREGQIRLVDATYQNTGDLINVYEIPFSAKQARALAENQDLSPNGCSPPASKDYDLYDPSPVFPGDEVLMCWRLTENDVQFQPQYQSAVVTRAMANVSLVPGCAESPVCPSVELRTVAAASLDQSQPPSDYGEYFDQRNPDVTLTVNARGPGGVTGPGIYCSNGGGDCTEAIEQGTSVTLVAHPGNEIFEGWSGACSGTGLRCTVSMNANTTVNANFRNRPTPPPQAQNTIITMDPLNPYTQGGQRYVRVRGQVRVASGAKVPHGTVTLTMTRFTGGSSNQVVVNQNVPVDGSYSYNYLLSYGSGVNRIRAVARYQANAQFNASETFREVNAN